MSLDDFKQLSRGLVDIIPKDLLLDKLKLDRPLRIKAGFDPTSCHLHLGHTVLLSLLSRFAKMGHTIVFLVGDFTAMIGDPTGKSVTRPPLTKEEIQQHASTYTEQVGKVLDLSKTEIVYNSSWLENMRAQDLIKLSSKQTVARMLERDDFKKRFANETPIAIHEFLYPLLQGYDSYAVQADIEIGGTDQLFNLLMGREVQKAYGQEQQAILTLPLLEGTDGVNKMSKSLNNTIDICGDPNDMYGQIMSLSDTLMWRYYELLSERSIQEIEELKKSVDDGVNPRDIKMQLAFELVDRFHGQVSADNAQSSFVGRFQKQLLPDEIPEVKIEVEGSLPLAQVLKRSNLVASSSEGMRMIKQGAVKINSERVDDNIILESQSEGLIIQVGKRRIAKVMLCQ